MAKATYTCTFSSELLFSSHPSASLSGPSTYLPDGAIVTNVEFEVYCGVSQYNYYADTDMTLTDGSGASTTIRDTCYTGSENRLWAEFGDEPGTQLDWNNLTTISLSGTNKLTVRTGQTATLTLEYMTYSKVGAPDAVTVGNANAAPGAKVTLSWSGATAGENNPIAGYWIYRATDPEGVYTLLTSVSSTATSGSATVTAPTTNGSSYYYKVRTVCANSAYDSDVSVVYATLTCAYSSLGAPTAVSVSPTNAAPGGEATLTWSGAMAGTNNSIRGYEVYRATSTEGTYSRLTTVTTTDTSGSLTVTAPTNNGNVYCYKVLALGTLTGYNSDMSSVYAMLSCTFSAPTAPTLTANGEQTLYIKSGEAVTLSWTGATDGANNPITGYQLYRNGVSISTIPYPDITSVSLSSVTQAGGYYVVAKGKHSTSSNSNVANVKLYTDPVAPTSVTVSNGNPLTGSRVVLSWANAASGTNNAVVGYRVYRSSEVNGDYKLVASLSTTATSGSSTVDAPPTAGGVYYYRVETHGVLSTSGQSSAYATVTAGEAPSGEDSDITVIVKPTKRKKRGLVLGEYDTAEEGWTLCELALTEPETQTNYVEVLGRSLGPIDMSTSLTGGDPRYGSRTLEARLECSEWTRDERNDVISVMTNRLHGQRVNIVLPDDPTRYVTGRVSVAKEYSDMAHASVALSAVCDPWRYSKTEKVVEVMLLDEETQVMLSNEGRRVISPEVTVSGYGADVRLTCGDGAWSLNEGTYHLSGLTLKHGNTMVTCNGFGTVTFKYREAIL